MNIIYRSVRNHSNLNVLLHSAVNNRLLIYKNISICSQRINLEKKSCYDYSYKKRWYSENNSGPPSNKLPSLLPDFPVIVWPSFLKTLKNFVLFNFIIKPYLDNEFSLPDFVGASKKAVEVVSRKLAEGDVKSLDGLVTNDIISSLQKALSLMSLSQREQIAINVEDIYFSFPYQVGIIFNDEEGKDQKRFVEITMVYHTLKGLSNMRSRGEEPPLNMGMLPEYQKLISICNYRFIREFTKGVDDQWTVNLLNHFKPSDEL